jgi:hypothetical protein
MTKARKKSFLQTEKMMLLKRREASFHPVVIPNEAKRNEEPI